MGECLEMIFCAFVSGFLIGIAAGAGAFVAVMNHLSKKEG